MNKLKDHRKREVIPAVVIEAPTARTFDARSDGLDERGLRQWVQAWSSNVEAPHVSRSCCFPYAVVAWHTEPVGVDIVRTTAGDSELRSVWSSQEALTRALDDGLDDGIECDPRPMEPPTFWPDGEAGPWRALKLEVFLGHVAWVCWRVGGARTQLGSRGPCSRRATSSSSRSSSRPRVTASSSAAQ